MATTQAIVAPRDRFFEAATTALQRIFSFPVFLGALLVAGTFTGSRFNLLDPDTWWHLKVGEQILRTHHLPTADPYSFTVSGTAWVAYEWLGEVIMALAGRVAGLRGPSILLVSLASVLMLLLYYLAWLRSGNSKAAFVACLVVLPAATAFFTLRPQLLGFIFLVSTLICLERFRQGRSRALFFLPPLFLIWVNTHGTFVFGLFGLGLAWACGQWSFQMGGVAAQRWTAAQSRSLVIMILLCVLVLPITPYGTRLAAYPLEMSVAQPLNVASIQEWQPLSFNFLLGRIFLLLVLAAFLAYAVQQIQFRLQEMALLIFGVFAACLHLRFVLIFLLFFIPMLAVLLARWIPAYEAAKDRFGLNAALVILMAAGLVFFFPSNQILQEHASKTYPREAVEYLRGHPLRGPIFNEYGWGGYLIWSFGTDAKVFVDGRADLYEYAGVLPDYLSIARLEPDTLALLQKYNIQACLIERKAPLSTMLAALPDWQRVYEDSVAALYVHRQRHVPVRLTEPQPALSGNVLPLLHKVNAKATPNSPDSENSLTF